MEAMHEGKHEMKGSYGRLLAMTMLSFVAMFILMYAMVDRLENVYVNFNQVYMAGLMAAPMVLIEMVLMRSMYPNAKLNAAIILATLVVMMLCWVFIRQWIFRSCEATVPDHGKPVTGTRLSAGIAV